MPYLLILLTFQILLCGGKKGFEFDKVFPERSNQKEVFDMVQPVIQHVWQGYHATVLAYGQTGTGKTYTMGTKKENHESDVSKYFFIVFKVTFFQNGNTVYNYIKAPPHDVTPNDISAISDFEERYLRHCAHA